MHLSTRKKAAKRASQQQKVGQEIPNGAVKWHPAQASLDVGQQAPLSIVAPSPVVAASKDKEELSKVVAPVYPVIQEREAPTPSAPPLVDPMQEWAECRVKMSALKHDMDKLEAQKSALQRAAVTRLRGAFEEKELLQLQSGSLTLWPIEDDLLSSNVNAWEIKTIMDSDSPLNDPKRLELCLTDGTFLRVMTSHYRYKGDDVRKWPFVAVVGSLAETKKLLKACLPPTMAVLFWRKGGASSE